MSRRRLERLLNLTMCLMATSRFLTVAEIGQMVDGYDPGADDDGHEAFRRMFERDKQYLRGLGIPLETGSDSAFSDEVGYRIRRGDYALPEISLDSDEAAALALAATLWSSSTLAVPAASALRKIDAAGGPAGGGTALPDLDGFEPRVGAAEPAFDAALAAVQKGQAVRFPYRKPGEADSTEREVEPWGVVSWRGRWYLVGHDRVREAARVFRLSRVTGLLRPVGKAGAVTVPPGIDLRTVVSAAVPIERTRTAALRIRRGAGHALRRRGRLVEAAPAVDGGSPDQAVFDLFEINYADTEWLARWVAGYGPDVLVVAPAALRAAVVRRLRATAAGHSTPTAAAASTASTASTAAPPARPAPR